MRYGSVHRWRATYHEHILNICYCCFVDIFRILLATRRNLDRNSRMCKGHNVGTCGGMLYQSLPRTIKSDFM